MSYFYFVPFYPMCFVTPVSLVLIALTTKAENTQLTHLLLLSLTHTRTSIDEYKPRALLLITETNFQTDFAIIIPFLVHFVHTSIEHFMLLNFNFQRMVFLFCFWIFVPPFHNEHGIFVLSQNKCQLLTQFGQTQYE